jgi:hypothetical protein
MILEPVRLGVRSHYRAMPSRIEGRLQDDPFASNSALTGTERPSRLVDFRLSPAIPRRIDKRLADAEAQTSIATIIARMLTADERSSGRDDLHVVERTGHLPGGE